MGEAWRSETFILQCVRNSSVQQDRNTPLLWRQPKRQSLISFSENARPTMTSLLVAEPVRQRVEANITLCDW